MAIYKLKKEKNVFIAFVDIFSIIADITKNIIQPPIYHADNFETSIMMALEQNVKKEKLIKEVANTKIPKFIKLDVLTSPSSIKIPVYIKDNKHYLIRNNILIIIRYFYCKNLL